MAEGDRRVTTIQAFTAFLTVVAAAAVVGAHVHDGFEQVNREMSPPSLLVAEWQSINSGGIRKGSDDPALVATAFLDFTCPYSRGLARLLESLLADHPDDVAIVFHHFVSDRTESVRLAVATECAWRQQRFWSLYSEFIFTGDLGVRPMTAFAKDAGIRDIGVFEDCLELPVGAFPRIQYGTATAKVLGARGTPMLLVNGEMRAVRNPEDLEDWLRLAMDERLSS